MAECQMPFKWNRQKLLVWRLNFSVALKITSWRLFISYVIKVGLFVWSLRKCFVSRHSSGLYPGYPLSSNNCLSLRNLLSLFCGFLHILITRRVRLKGIDQVVQLGWQLSPRRYWFLSVGLRCRYVSMWPSSRLQDVSRKGIELLNSQSHLSC